MANNIVVKDANGNDVTVQSTDNASVQLPAHQIVSSDGANALDISVGGAAKVDGSAVTQPISGTVSISGSVTVSGTVAATQSGTWNITNISGTISLPTGAATAAKQPALGTAGSASSDVITVQGIGSMTPILTTLSGTNNINTVSTVTTVATVTSVTQNADVRQSTASNLNAQTVGNIASDSADSGNPIKVGSRAIAALSGTTLVSAADRVDAQGDLDGAIITRNNYALGDVVSGANTTTGTSAVEVIAAPGANVFLYISAVQVANTGASASLITFQRDTGGSPATLGYTIAPAGGGSNIRFDPPLKVSTANQNFGFTAATGSTTIYVSAQGFKSKI